MFLSLLDDDNLKLLLDTMKMDVLMLVVTGNLLLAADGGGESPQRNTRYDSLEIRDTKLRVLNYFGLLLIIVSFTVNKVTVNCNCN
jgi:hypothetical protein